MNRIAVIQKLELVLFSRNEARINIYYLGDEQLSLALAQADMRLSQVEVIEVAAHRAARRREAFLVNSWGNSGDCSRVWGGSREKQ